MTTPLIPQAFWFRLAMPSRRNDQLPKPTGKRLLDLPDASALPDTTRLDGKSPWAYVKTAWNPSGLAVQVEVETSLDALGDPESSAGRHGVNLWVDTRDTRDISRATRFCHAFEFLLAPGAAKTATLDLRVRQKPISRAISDSPICDPKAITTRIDRTRSGYRLEIFLPTAVLHGFDAENNRRLGFAYSVTDPDRESQILGAGPQFPMGDNPSLWSTLELVDGD